MNSYDSWIEKNTKISFHNLKISAPIEGFLSWHRIKVHSSNPNANNESVYPKSFALKKEKCLFIAF